MIGWSGFVFVTVLVPALLTGEPANPAWPKPTTPAGRWALFTLHFFSTVFLPVAFFCGVAMLRGTTFCAGALMTAVGELTRRARTESEVRRLLAGTTHLLGDGCTDTLLLPGIVPGPPVGYSQRRRHSAA